MKKRFIGETLFVMVYGTKAIIPTEMGLPTPRTKIVNNEEKNYE